jgi:hypothetical protein
MISWIRIFIKPSCIPVDCRQLPQPLIDRTPAWWSEASTRENVARFGTELLFVQALIQQLLNLTKRPTRATALEPLGIRRWAVELFIRRITSRGEARERPGHRNATPGFDPAINLPRDELLAAGVPL